MKYAYIALALFLYAGNSAAQLPFDSVIVRFNNYPCHYHTAHQQDGVQTYESDADIIYTSAIYFSFDSTNVSGDTVNCFNKKSISWQYLRIIYDSITSTIKYFNFVQLFKYQINPTRRDYAFNNISVVMYKDSLSGSISGSEIIGANLMASDKSSYYVYGPGGKGSTSWQNDYVYLGTTTDSTSLSFQMLAAYHHPLGVNSERNLESMFYPNPTNDRIFLSGLSNTDEVRIYDLLGRLILRSPVAPELDLSKLPKGIYRIEVSGKVQSLILN
jgi:type IX secretion system substrate protein